MRADDGAAAWGISASWPLAGQALSVLRVWWRHVQGKLIAWQHDLSTSVDAVREYTQEGITPCEVFPRVLGFALGILPVLLTIGGPIGGIHAWVDQDNRRYLLRLREESRLRQQQLDDEISARDRATRRVREAS